jgi:MoxR-like ATPase
MSNPFASSPDKITDFGRVLLPAEALEPILSKSVRGAALEWLTEIGASNALKEVGLRPRSKALFDGKPGTGKTTLAHHLAARIGLRMLSVRSDRIIDKWVGSSAENMGALFDVIEREKEPIILFFDEFDSLADKRNGTQHKAITQMVNTLLQRMEQFGGFIIAATNFAEEIDSAIWRRFDIQIKLDLPGKSERKRILERYFSPYRLSRFALERLADAFETATPALMRQFAESVKRNLVIGPKVGWDMRRDAVIERVLAAVQPHASLGKPRLWTHGIKDEAVLALPWPLTQEAPSEDEVVAEDHDRKIVPLRVGANA